MGKWIARTAGENTQMVDDINSSNQWLPFQADDTVLISPVGPRPYVPDFKNRDIENVLGGTTAEDNEERVFTDSTEWFGIRVITKSGERYFTRWYALEKLSMFMDMYEREVVEGIDDRWISVYLPEGVAYLKRKDIVSVTFYSREWWNQNFATADNGFREHRKPRHQYIPGRGEGSHTAPQGGDQVGTNCAPTTTMDSGTSYGN